MASITQTIPSYIGGISQQPDELKVPGQLNVAKNVMPDITESLAKRPGGKFIKEIATGVTTGTDKYKWFNFYENSSEQFIGRITLADGVITMWRCSDGKEYNESIGNLSYVSSTATAIKNYIKHGTSIKSSDVQTLSVYDQIGTLKGCLSTYITNRNKIVKMSDTNKTSTKPYEAYVELKQLEYGEQYPLNFYNSTTTRKVYTATRLGLEVQRGPSDTCRVIDANSSSAPPQGVLPGYYGTGAGFVTSCQNSAVLDFKKTDWYGGYLMRIGEKWFNPEIGTQWTDSREHSNDHEGIYTYWRKNSSGVYTEYSDNDLYIIDIGHGGTWSNQWFELTDGVTSTNYLIGSSNPANYVANPSEFLAKAESMSWYDATFGEDGDWEMLVLGYNYVSYGHTNGASNDDAFKNTEAQCTGLVLAIRARDNDDKGTSTRWAMRPIQGSTIGSYVSSTKIPRTVVTEDNPLPEQLHFHVKTLGQSSALGEGAKADFSSYATLKHGGHGWKKDDYVLVYVKNQQLKITIEEDSVANVRANLALVRPPVTAFHGDQVVTTDSILGNIRQELIKESTFDWVRSGTVLQVNQNNHGFSAGDKVDLDFPSGSLSDLTNQTITAVSSAAFQIAVSDSGATSGTVVVNFTEANIQPIGNGFYIKSPSKFNISTPSGRLLNVLSGGIDTIEDLPQECKHNYVVTVNNSEADEDDYYLKFLGDNNLDGKGIWEEVPAPDRQIQFDYSTMPVVLIKTPEDTFKVSQLDGTIFSVTTSGTYSQSGTTVTVTKTNHGFTAGSSYITISVTSGSGLTNARVIVDSTPSDNTFTYTATNSVTTSGNCDVGPAYVAPEWEDCEVGDLATSPEPSFVDSTINKILFFRNRLAFLSDENIILSRPGNSHHFWSKTAITVTPSDPIDIKCSADNPTKIYSGTQVNSGLLLFSDAAQYMVTTDSDTMTPLTAKINFLSSYQFNTDTEPFSLGTTVGFLDNAGKNTRFWEMAQIRREGEPVVVDQTKVVSNLFNKNIKHVSTSKENSVIFFSEDSQSTLYVYKYFSTGEKRVQASWFTWELSGDIQYHTVQDDALYVVIRNGNKDVLQRFDLKLHDGTITITDNMDTAATTDDVTYKVHLDNVAEVSGLSSNAYSSTTGLTTFGLPTGYNSSKQLVAYDNSAGSGDSDTMGMYGLITVNGSTCTVPGDWTSNSFLIGYVFDMEVEFPTIHITNQAGESYKSDVAGTLVLHRAKLSLGEAGLFDTVLDRKGKPTYTETWENPDADWYRANQVNVSSSITQTVPIYEKNTNLTLTLKSSHPSPLTLQSLTWEGDYNTKFYRRA